MKGFAFHCHHEVLVEYVTDYQERVGYIKSDKPKEEQELRLRLFQMIPDDRIPSDLFKARAAFNKASDAYYKARDAYNKARDAFNKARDAYNKARAAYDKASDACDKASDAYNKAWDARNKARDACDKAISEHQDTLNKLHEELCPDCPWDGHTIFPKENS